MSITIVLADDHAVLRDSLQFLLGAQADFTVVGVAWRGRCYRAFGLPWYRGRVIIEIGPCSSAG
jgi:DNA-binding NarL/FixJ family response regulator